LALTATGDKNIGTLVDEPLCRGEAYSAVSACDDCDFSFKLFHGFLPFVHSHPDLPHHKVNCMLDFSKMCHNEWSLLVMTLLGQISSFIC
jgi:hypothetical protein